MLTIYKYPLKLEENQIIKMPAGAEILTVQLQKNKPVLWAKVDDESPKEESVMIKLAVTGGELNACEMLHYLATVQMQHGIVLHCFKVSNH